MCNQPRSSWIAILLYPVLICAACTGRVPASPTPDIQPVVLATPLFDIQQPSWSATSTSVAFRAMKLAQEVTQQLYVYNVDTGTLSRYLDLPSGNVYSPSWTHHDQHLAALTGVQGQYADVDVATGDYVFMDIQARDVQALDVGSSSGQLYALYSTDSNLSDLNLAIQSRQGTWTATFPLVQGEEVSADRGVVDPTETKVAFSVKAVKGGTYRVGFLEVASGDVRWLSDPASDSRSPTWSPNGAWLAYLEIDTASALVVTSPEKGCSQRVPLHIPFASGLSWSADGTKFALSDGADLYIVPAQELLGQSFDFSSKECQPDPP